MYSSHIEAAFDLNIIMIEHPEWHDPEGYAEVMFGLHCMYQVPYDSLRGPWCLEEEYTNTDKTYMNCIYIKSYFTNLYHYQKLHYTDDSRSVYFDSSDEENGVLHPSPFKYADDDMNPGYWWKQGDVEVDADLDTRGYWRMDNIDSSSDIHSI